MPTINLSVPPSDGIGAESLIYTWSAVSVPPGSPPVTFVPNGTNAAQNTTASLYAAGTYSFRALATANVPSSIVSVTVDQVLTSLVLSPASVSLAPGATQQFTVIAKDQFGNAMSPQPFISWSLNGAGTLSLTGLYTAPASAGSATVMVGSSGLNSSAPVTVTSTTPTLASITLYPGTLTLAAGASQAFVPAPRDQFGNLVSPRPAYTWELVTGGGALSTSGVYTAPPSGNATIKVTANGLTATAVVSVDNAFTSGIFFDSGTGVLTLKTNAYSNVVTIAPNPFDPTKVNVTMSGTNSVGGIVLSQSQQIPIAQITYIYFYGQAAYNIVLTNQTAIPSTCYGGSGTNHFIGGSGIDYLYAGANSINSTLEGMGGDDFLIGGAGTTYFYGRAGNNTLLAGSGKSYFLG